MFPLADMFHFLANKFARLGRRRLAFLGIFASTFYRFFFWHNKIVSPLRTVSDVTNTKTDARLCAMPVGERANGGLISSVLQRPEGF